MAEGGQDLGLANLRIEVDVKEAQRQLDAFRQEVVRQLSGIKADGLFVGLDKSAKVAGERVGKALSDGVKNATKSLRFSSVEEALSFNPGNTVKGLQQYSRALQALRDRTDISAQGTQRLNDRISALESAIRRARQTTAEATAEQQRFNAALDKSAYQRLIDSARIFRENLKQQARATDEASKRFAEFRKQAEGVAKALLSISAKGVTEALKVPIFGLPKNVTGTLDKARAQIEALQKQAETASGRVARLTEGVAALGVGGAAAKGIIDTLGGIGTSAQGVTGILAQVREALGSLPGPLKGLGGLDEVFASGSQAVQQWAASVLQAQGDLATLSAPLQAVTDALSALGPEAAAVGGALAFTFAGFQDIISNSFKPGIDGARQALKGMTDDTQKLLEALARVSQASSGVAALRDLEQARSEAALRVESAPVGSVENLDATKELLEINKRIREEKQRQFYQEQRLLLSERERAELARRITNAADTQAPLALPAFRERGLQRLDLQQQDAEARRKAGAEFISRLERGAAAERGPTGLPSAGLFDLFGQALSGLSDAIKRGTKIANERTAELERQLTARFDAGVRRDRAIAEFGAVPVSGRLRDGTILPGSPAAREEQRRARKERNKRLQEASANALIGGAFPALFGQGVGASLGGLLGGAGGGLVGGQFGFGLSLVGTALGAQFDLAQQKIQTLSAALSNPIKQFGALAEAGLLSSKALEKQIEALINTGREAEAAALIQQDLNSTYGDQSSAQGLVEANDELNRSFTRLQVSAAAVASGGLKSLIDLLSKSFNQKFVASQIGELRDTLDPERRAQLDRELQGAFGSRPRGFGRSGAPLSQAEIELVDTDRLQSLLAQYKEATDTNEQEAAQKRFTQLRKLSFELIEAEVNGNQRLTFELKKQQIELERRNKLQALGPSAPQAAVDQIELDAQRETFRITQQQTRLDRQQTVERLAGLNKIKSIQEQIFVASQRGVLGQGGAEAANTIVQLRDSARAAQQARVAARLTPADLSLTQQAQQASESVRLGFVEARNALVDGLKQAKDQAREIARSIQDTALNLLELRGTGQGLSRFLSGDARRQEQNASFLALLPQFFRAREAAARDAAGRGNFAAAEQFRNLNFSGSTEAVNQAMVDFIKAQRTEERLQEELIRSNTELVDVQRSVATYTEALSQVSSRLADLLPGVETAMSQLASKEWNVSVNVPGGSASGDVVGAVNSRL